jgi:hypothetical protein
MTLPNFATHNDSICRVQPEPRSSTGIHDCTGRVPAGHLAWSAAPKRLYRRINSAFLSQQSLSSGFCLISSIHTSDSWSSNARFSANLSKRLEGRSLVPGALERGSLLVRSALRLTFCADHRFITDQLGRPMVYLHYVAGKFPELDSRFWR